MNLKLMLLTVRTSFYYAVQECAKVVTVKKLLGTNDVFSSIRFPSCAPALDALGAIDFLLYRSCSCCGCCCCSAVAAALLLLLLCCCCRCSPTFSSFFSFFKDTTRVTFLVFAGTKKKREGFQGESERARQLWRDSTLVGCL